MLVPPSSLTVTKSTRKVKKYKEDVGMGLACLDRLLREGGERPKAVRALLKNMG